MKRITEYCNRIMEIDRNLTETAAVSEAELYVEAEKDLDSFFGTPEEQLMSVSAASYEYRSYSHADRIVSIDIASPLLERSRIMLGKVKDIRCFLEKCTPDAVEAFQKTHRILDNGLDTAHEISQMSCKILEALNEVDGQNDTKIEPYVVYSAFLLTCSSEIINVTVSLETKLLNLKTRKAAEREFAIMSSVIEVPDFVTRAYNKGL